MSKQPIIFVVESVAGQPFDEASAIATLARLMRAMDDRDTKAASEGRRLILDGKTEIEETVAAR
jgi:hypothetical protein